LLGKYFLLLEAGIILESSQSLFHSLASILFSAVAISYVVGTPVPQASFNQIKDCFLESLEHPTKPPELEYHDLLGGAIV